MTAEAFPHWIGSASGRPPAHLPAVVPRQRAGLFDARFTGPRRPVHLAGAVLLDHLLGERSTGAGHAVQRDRRDDRDVPERSAERSGRGARRADLFGGPTPERDRHLEFERRFNLTLTSGYALSESPYGMIWPREGPPPYGAIGSLRQHPKLGEVNEARVVDDQGAPVQDGVAGELLLRNPAVMLGYYRLPEETQAVLRDGWLHTGDLVRQDADGIYWFLGRKKEVIRRRGRTSAHARSRRSSNEHPAVAECAVVGVPSEVSEEDVKAFVRPAEERRCLRRGVAGLVRRAAECLQGPPLRRVRRRLPTHSHATVSPSTDYRVSERRARRTCPGKESGERGEPGRRPELNIGVLDQRSVALGVRARLHPPRVGAKRLQPLRALVQAVPGEQVVQVAGPSDVGSARSRPDGCRRPARPAASSPRTGPAAGPSSLR